MRRFFLIIFLALLAGCGAQNEGNTNEDVASGTAATEATSEDEESEDKPLSTIPTEKVEILKDE